MKYYFLILLSLLSVACDKEADEVVAIAPTNLKLTVTTGDNGKVSLSATATGVNFYNFYFGDTNDESPTFSQNGKVEHTYGESGTYRVKVQAHTTDAVFVSKEKEVQVELDNTVDPGDGGSNIPTTGYTTPEAYDGYDLVWQDEFNGSGLSSDWTHEIGTGSNGWGNNELQYYREENTTVEDGYLIIEAKEAAFGGQSYTSSRIVTQGNESFQYGRIDIRAALPQGQGIWPALWMLGDNFSTIGWPASGEIDIMELVGGPGGDNTSHGTVHWDHDGSYASYGDSYTLPSGIFADEFHVFTLIWDASTIKWYVDDELFNTIDITPAELSEFQNSFFFIFNVAVGGDWPGSPDSSTVFPQRMVVDYVRVFQVQ